MLIVAKLFHISQELEQNEEEGEGGWTAVGRRGWDAAAAVMSAVGGLARTGTTSDQTPTRQAIRLQPFLPSSLAWPFLFEAAAVQACSLTCIGAASSYWPHMHTWIPWINGRHGAGGLGRAARSAAEAGAAAQRRRTPS